MQYSRENDINQLVELAIVDADASDSLRLGKRSFMALKECFFPKSEVVADHGLLLVSKPAIKLAHCAISINFEPIMFNSQRKAVA